MSGAILVTGATGFLGRHVLRMLADRSSEEIRVLVRREARSLNALAEQGVRQVPGDVLDADSVAKAIRGVTQVYHLAGVVSRDPKDATSMMRVHVDGTRHVLEAAQRARVERIVVASSSGTIAVSKDQDFVATEESPYAFEAAKNWPYYLSKIYQEQLALKFARDGLPVVILNPSLLLGPGDTRGSSTDDVRKFMQQQIPVMPEGGINFVDVRDTAAAFLTAMARGRDGERYLLGGPNWTFDKFFGRLSRLAKVPAPKLRLPEKLSVWGATMLEEYARWRGVEPRVDRMSVEMSQHYWYVDSSKAERELGFAARDPQETLADTIRYIRKHFLTEATDTWATADLRP